MADEIKEATAEISKKPKKPKGVKTGKGNVTPPEVTASIVTCFLSGVFQSDEDIAKHVGVSRSTVAKIKKHIPEDILHIKNTATGARIEALVLEFLEETLESLKRISRLTLNDEWLQKQTAVELATFFGVKADRVLKILEAIERANQPEETGDPELVEASED